MLKLITVSGASLLLALAASAATPSDQDHAAHHPDGAASTPDAAAANPTPAKRATKGSMAMDKQMEVMHQMHEKMMAAKTPEERQALMADQMKTMKDGMAMLGPSSNTEKRMEMMESMMQMMMMDRMEAIQPR